MAKQEYIKHSRLSQRVEEEAQKAISENLKIYKVAVVSFVAGFVMFIGAGLVTKGEMFKSIVKSFYPPSEIYADVIHEFLKDEDFKRQLVNRTNYGELIIPDATLKTFPGISKELPRTVWHAISSGDDEDYERMVSRPEFFNALVKYHTDIARSFLLPTSSKLERASQILEIGKIPLNAQLLMAGGAAEGVPTATCYKPFSNQAMQAIVVIPESALPHEYSWFNCSFGWPSITLKINEIDGISLVGVRRNGKTNRLIVLLSQKAAESLDLVGWEEYKANSLGKVVITNAE